LPFVQNETVHLGVSPFVKTTFVFSAFWGVPRKNKSVSHYGEGVRFFIWFSNCSREGTSQLNRQKIITGFLSYHIAFHGSVQGTPSAQKADLMKSLIGIKRSEYVVFISRSRKIHLGYQSSSVCAESSFLAIGKRKRQRK
jgi:hypothetical protein